MLAGCGDTAASFLACGATEPGVCIDVAGTASVFAATTRDFMPDVSSGILGCGRSVITGLWHPYAYVNGGGQNLEWFRTAVLNQARSFAELDAAAADDTNDAELPFFVPHLGGRVSPAWPHLRGAWVGLHWNVSEASLFRAMLENAASEQGSRMTAMDNATRNAGDMINRLTIQYNRTRQAAITTELVEIISGAEAL